MREEDKQVHFWFYLFTVFLRENQQNCKIDIRFIQYLQCSSSLLRSFHYFPGAEILHGDLYNMYLQYFQSFSCINRYFVRYCDIKKHIILNFLHIPSELFWTLCPKYQFIPEKLLGYWRYILYKCPCKISAPGK